MYLITFYCTHLGLPLELLLWAEVKVFQILFWYSYVSEYVHLELMHCWCHLPDFSHFLKNLQQYIHSCVYQVFLRLLVPEIWEILLSFLCQGIPGTLFIFKGGTQDVFSTSVLCILSSFKSLKLLSPAIHTAMSSGCLGYRTLHTQEKNCPSASVILEYL